MDHNKIIQVEWDGGNESGFASMGAAERFINKVCYKVAPKHNYKKSNITSIK